MEPSAKGVWKGIASLSSALQISELQIDEGLHFAAAHLYDDEYQEEKQDELHNERFARQKTAGSIAP